MLSDKEFEDLIRRKMAALDEAPPVDGWKKIAADIRPPKKRHPIWWWLGPLLLLLTGLGVYYFPANSPANKPSEIIVSNEHNNDAPAATLTPNPEKENRSTKIEKKQTDTTKTTAPSFKPASVAEADNLTEPIKKKSTLNNIKKKPIRRRVGQVAGISKNKPGGSIKSDGPLPVIPHEETNQQPEPQQPTQTFHAAIPAIATDSVNTLTEQTQPDTVQVATRKDSTTFENKELAQEQTAKEDEKKNKPKTWEAGFTFATRYAFRKFTPNAADDIFITNVTTRNQTHPERLGYEFGFNLARALTKNFYIETGIAWLQLKENLTYTYTTGTIDTILVTAAPGQTNINPVYKMEERQLASSYAYGGWRLGATYYFWNNGRRRFNFSLAGGLNLLLKGETEEYQNGQYLRKVVFPSRANILEQANYNLLVGAGYNTRWGQKLELMLMPSLNYFMGSTFKEREPLGLRPYSLGLNITLKRRFSRQN